MASAVTWSDEVILTRLPSESYESVEHPSKPIARYSFVESRNLAKCFVALWVPMTGL